MTTNAARDLAATLDRIAGDDRARRELLWLQAKGKEDDEVARDLERQDPGIVRRLVEAGLDVADRPCEVPRARRQRFADLWHQCFERHARSA